MLEHTAATPALRLPVLNVPPAHGTQFSDALREPDDNTA
jgi:hypothetical protein